MRVGTPLILQLPCLRRRLAYILTLTDHKFDKGPREGMTTDYTYGDGKTYDAANFGLFKQNWGMLRVCATRYGLAGQSEADWNNGAILKYEFFVPEPYNQGSRL